MTVGVKPHNYKRRCFINNKSCNTLASLFNADYVKLRAALKTKASWQNN